MTEVWLQVPGFDLLEASSLGRVRSKPYSMQMPNGGIRERKMAPTYGLLSWSEKKALNGRMIILFRRKTYKVATLVCLAFHGDRPFPRAKVLHGDEDSMNNAESNLSWGTQSENLSAPKFKERSREQRVGKFRQKLTDAQARRVKFGNEGPAALAAILPISASSVCNIRAGRTWRDLEEI